MGIYNIIVRYIKKIIFYGKYIQQYYNEQSKRTNDERLFSSSNIKS